MRRDPYLEAAERELDFWPGVEWREDGGKRHKRIVLSQGGAERFVVFASTGSDSRRGPLNFLTNLRAELRALGAVRVEAPAAQRAERAPRRSSVARSTPLPSISDPRPDGFAALRELQQRMRAAPPPTPPQPTLWARVVALIFPSRAA